MGHTDVGQEKPGETEKAAALSRRSGRRPGLSSTRADILHAARKLFAQNGYDGTTMRAIASEARVDAALIHHFYRSKEGIFSAAIEDALDIDEVVNHVVAGTDRDSVGERLIRALLEAWQNPARREPMIAVLRSAMSHPDAARLLTDFVKRNVLRNIVKAVGCDHEELRATLAGSQIIGLIMLRFVTQMEPLATLDEDIVVATISPTIQRYLTADLGLSARLTPHAANGAAAGGPV